MQYMMTSWRIHTFRITGIFVRRIYKLLVDSREEPVIQNLVALLLLTYWDRMIHICVSKLTIIGSDNGLSPGPRQAIF